MPSEQSELESRMLAALKEAIELGRYYPSALHSSGPAETGGQMYACPRLGQEPPQHPTCEPVHCSRQGCGCPPIPSLRGSGRSPVVVVGFRAAAFALRPFTPLGSTRLSFFSLF